MPIMRNRVAFAALTLGCVTAAVVPSVPLFGASVPGLTMPAIGLGTGAYGLLNLGYDHYPECFMEVLGCGQYATRATEEWLAAGGRRLDCANSYNSQKSVGAGMSASGVPRSDLFVLSKIGSSNAMGFNETIQQVAGILSDMNTTYLDLVLNHWFSVKLPSTDPPCNYGAPSYDAAACRVSTWRGLLEVFASGAALSIGVSNYNSSHLQEILDAGLPLPSVNQIPYNLYRSTSQSDTFAFCRAHNITVVAYSPLGIPDFQQYPEVDGLSKTLLESPALVSVAAAHGISPAQAAILWLWQQGIPTNPRSSNASHMAENLAVYGLGVTLSDAEMNLLSHQPQDTCALDPFNYECAPTVASTSAAAPPQWTRVMYDDFDGPTLDPNRWNIAHNKTHTDAEEQLYTSDNVYIQSGALVLRTQVQNATSQSGRKYQFTSGWVDTLGKVELAFGRFEARIKLPKELGSVWPAYWLVDDDHHCWPVGGEIDILEAVGNYRDDAVFGTYHWGSACGVDGWSKAQENGAVPRPHNAHFSDDYHNFSVWWNATAVTWAVDESPYVSRITGQPASLTIATWPMYTILNVAMSSWGPPPHPPSTAGFPTFMAVDWVAAYAWNGPGGADGQFEIPFNATGLHPTL